MSQGYQNVPFVRDVTLILIESNPPQLSITAIGVVPTTGFTALPLIPYLYFVPPADGIYDFAFIVDFEVPPGGHVGNIVHPIFAQYTLAKIPAGLKGIRVHASINNKEVLLNSKDVIKKVGIEFGPGGIPILD
jgi:hypothetical protein